MRLFLRLCTQARASQPTPYDRTYLDDACEYAFYVHLRVILGFFEHTGKTLPDDITYRTFKPHWQKPYTPPDAKDVCPAILRTSLNKRVAHLSKARQGDQPTDPETNDALQFYLDYGEKISPAISDFVKNLKPQLQQSFNERTIAFQARDRKQPRTLQDRFRIPA